MKPKISQPSNWSGSRGQDHRAQLDDGRRLQVSPQGAQDSAPTTVSNLRAQPRQKKRPALPMWVAPAADLMRGRQEFGREALCCCCRAVLTCLHWQPTMIGHGAHRRQEGSQLAAEPACSRRVRAPSETWGDGCSRQVGEATTRRESEHGAGRIIRSGHGVPSGRRPDAPTYHPPCGSSTRSSRQARDRLTGR